MDPKWDTKNEEKLLLNVWPQNPHNQFYSGASIDEKQHMLQVKYSNSKSATRISKFRTFTILSFETITHQKPRFFLPFSPRSVMWFSDNSFLTVL